MRCPNRMVQNYFSVFNILSSSYSISVEFVFQVLTYMTKIQWDSHFGSLPP